MPDGGPRMDIVTGMAVRPTQSNQRLLVVCHDAGGAEIVSSWVRQHFDKWDVTYFVDGPAEEIFRRKLGVKPDEEKKCPLDEYALVLCGSSARSSSGLERNMVFIARAAGVRSVVFLDHWKNYEERFDRLPDEVWVTDEYAHALASAALPGARVIVRGNRYLEETVAEIARLGRPRGRGYHVLWLSEDDGRSLTEKVRFLDAVKLIEPYGVRIRPHPAASSSETTLAEDVAWADTVVGWDSMAMVVALGAGRRVISLLPSTEAHIPFPGIEYLAVVEPGARPAGE